MRRHLYFLLKEQLCLELRKTRFSLKLTQEKMAELLCMSTRAYFSLEGGKYCCGVLTFLILLNYCPDRDELINRLISLVIDIKDDIA